MMVWTPTAVFRLRTWIRRTLIKRGRPGPGPARPMFNPYLVGGHLNALRMIAGGRLGYAKGALAPHCDQRVLHAPGDCESCDGFPDYQDLRVFWGIAFTGRPETGRVPDPASAYRSLESIELWPRNRASSDPRGTGLF